MADTPIDQAANLTSIRLKVPTGTVPVPPPGHVQFHFPDYDTAAIKRGDGSVVEIGGGGGGGDAVAGTGGIVTTAAGSFWGGAGVSIKPNTGLAILLDGPVVGPDFRPLGLQVDVVAISSAELLALHVTPKVLRPAPGVRSVIWPVAYFVFYVPGTTGYNADAAIAIGPASDPVTNAWVVFSAGWLSANTTIPTATQISSQPAISLETGSAANQALHAKAAVPWTGGDGSLVLFLASLVVQQPE